MVDVKKIPARYRGEHAVKLAPFGAPYYNAHGERLTDLIFRPGDTLMMPDHEVLGQTWLIDDRGGREPRYLGVGRIIQQEDAGKSDEELRALGYQFHEGRPDFEAIDTAATQPLSEEVEG